MNGNTLRNERFTMNRSAKEYFKDRVIIITGASGGIGRAAAVKFAELNAKVVLAARTEEKLLSLRNEIIQAGGQANTVQYYIKFQ